uniref:Actin filament associated protein 1 like 2 n=1 Tax=Tetraodon nigroviridis TaxID=99883 RepID=H3C3V6_TETNG
MDQLLVELHRFLLILDNETLSGNATIQKGLLSDLLYSYRASSEFSLSKHVQKPLHHAPIPPPQTHFPHIVVYSLTSRSLPSPHSCNDASESYYEEAQPYGESFNEFASSDDGEAVSSSYESYDEEEMSREKSPSTQHQWPSAEASIELMKDARICAFLWRKKWLGQWAKQLCVIKDHRLLCYKSSKEQTPLLDVSLLGCSVVYKEKQLKRKEHKLKIVPVGAEAIVLALQSKEQTEQWLRVIQEISPKPADNWEPQPSVFDSPRLICTKGELTERHSVASESGSSPDSHAETPECKDAASRWRNDTQPAPPRSSDHAFHSSTVKKKYGPGLMLSNLMNIGKKKLSSLDNPEKCVDTSGYLNVLVNSQWRTCWCLIKNGQLWFYQDKGKNKVSQPALTLEGCSVLADPSPEHLYSFRIDMDGTQLATLEAKTSAEMGHWLGLLLSQTGSKTDPEDLTYDYVNAERISTIVNAARTSLYLMQRRYSEPNTYIDTLPSNPHTSDELYDDVAFTADPEEQNDTCTEVTEDQVGAEPPASESRVYLDLVPVKSFLHTSCGRKSPSVKHDTCTQDSTEEPDPMPVLNKTSSTNKPEQEKPSTPTAPQTQTLQPLKTSQSQWSWPCTQDTIRNIRGGSPGAVEGKLGKNRTEARLRRYLDEHDRLEREREEVRASLASLKKEKREIKEELSSCHDPKEQALLEARSKQKEEECREAERRRVEVELQLVEVKENLKKAESGPFTLGTTLDSSLQESLSSRAAASPASQISSPAAPTPQPINSNSSLDAASPVFTASVLKPRPAAIMASKGKVLQKAKEWEKKSTT